MIQTIQGFFFLINIITITHKRALIKGSMTFRLNPFRLKDISSKRHFVEYDISSKFRLKVFKFV